MKSNLIHWSRDYSSPFLRFLLVSPRTDSHTMIKYFMCVKHNVLKLWLRPKFFLDSLFRIYFGWFPVVKVTPVLGATLAKRLSGGINPRSNDLWQERRCNGRGQRLPIISVKHLMVKSTTPSILLHCDVIGSIQHLSIRIPDHQSSSKCYTSHDI